MSLKTLTVRVILLPSLSVTVRVKLAWPQPVGVKVAVVPLSATVPFFASATGAFLFRQHFANLPADLAEAAQIDGVSPFQFLFKIIIPLSWNVIGALAVIQFIYGWNMYLWPLLLQPDDQVVQVGLGSLRNADQGQIYGPLMLGALVASIPPIVVFLVLVIN